MIIINKKGNIMTVKSKKEKNLDIIIGIFIVVFFGGLGCFSLFFLLMQELDNSHYKGEKRTEQNSVYVDILKKEYYIIENNNAKLDDKGILFNNFMKTYDGKSYVYNEKDLECSLLNEYNNVDYNIPQQENAYKEIVELDGKKWMIVYNKTAGGGRNGAYPIFYKNKKCMNFYEITNK